MHKAELKTGIERRIVDVHDFTLLLDARPCQGASLHLRLWNGQTLSFLKPEVLHVLAIVPIVEIDRGYMQPAAKGKTLNKKILEAIRIPVPPVRDQRAFVKSMNRLEAKAGELREKAADTNKEAHDLAHLQLARS